MTQEQIQAIVVASAKLAGILPELALAQCQAESNFNPEAVSPEGAVGLFQLEPATALQYGVSDSDMLFDPAYNSLAGCRYLKKLLADYGGNLLMALAAYNWGPGNIVRAKNSAESAGTWIDYLPTETGNYIQKVTAGMYAKLTEAKP
jgi:soluble lytic murein transglycosylase-like protein